jgi:hypothetical protein
LTASASESISPEGENEAKRGNIRDRLRAWEAENAAASFLSPRDYGKIGAPSNFLTRGQSPDMVEIDTCYSRDEHPLFDGDNLVDLRSDNVIFQAGDLVEIR